MVLLLAAKILVLLQYCRKNLIILNIRLMCLLVLSLPWVHGLMGPRRGHHPRPDRAALLTLREPLSLLGSSMPACEPAWRDMPPCEILTLAASRVPAESRPGKQPQQCVVEMVPYAYRDA